MLSEIMGKLLLLPFCLAAMFPFNYTYYYDCFFLKKPLKSIVHSKSEILRKNSAGINVLEDK